MTQPNTTLAVFEDLKTFGEFTKEYGGTILDFGAWSCGIDFYEGTMPPFLEFSPNC